MMLSTSCRPYQSADASALITIQRAIQSASEGLDLPLDVYLNQLPESGGAAWIAETAAEIVGYTAVSPLPGLDGIFTLEGFVAPDWQRRGIGRHLLTLAMEQTRTKGGKQLSHGVTTRDNAAARFLQAHQFEVDHEEWAFELTEFSQLSPVLLLSPYRWHTYQQRPRAIATFIRLYDASFGPHPWYQPYTPKEMNTLLEEPDDILFLLRHDEPVGFAWLQRLADGAGEIEPLGLLPICQGQGLGRFLVKAALHRMAQRAVAHVRIGCWRSNETAVSLYQSLGLQHRQTMIYLTRYLDH